MDRSCGVHPGVGARPDGSELTQVMDAHVSELAVTQERIYLVAHNGKAPVIHSMGMDGKDPRELNRGYSHFLNVDGDSIYYCSVDTLRVFGMKADGSGNAAINEDPSDYVNVSKGWIYYVNTADHGNIYRVKTDGTGRMRVTDVAPAADSSGLTLSGIWVIGDYVYTRGALPGEESIALRRVKCDGGDLTEFDGDTLSRKS